MKNPIPKFSLSRLKFVRLHGLKFVGRKWVVSEFFLKVRITKMRVLGWLDVFTAVKLALQHSCEKTSLRL